MIVKRHFFLSQIIYQDLVSEYIPVTMNSRSVNTDGLAIYVHRYISAQMPWWFSAAFCLVSNQKDHLTILLRNNEDKKQLGSRIPFDLPALISAHKLFKELQSLETGEVHQGKSRICLFIINYLHSMFYNIRCVDKA